MCSINLRSVRVLFLYENGPYIYARSGTFSYTTSRTRTPSSTTNVTTLLSGNIITGEVLISIQCGVIVPGVRDETFSRTRHRAERASTAPIRRSE